MRNGKVNDIVNCERAGEGDFKIIQVRNSGVSAEVLLQSLARPMNMQWIYEHHCNLEIKKTLAARLAAASIIVPFKRVRYG